MVAEALLLFIACLSLCGFRKHHYGNLYSKSRLVWKKKNPL